MENWTPEQWVIFIGALVTGLTAVIGSLAGLGKLYIDYLDKRDREELDAMKKRLDELQSKYDQMAGRYEGQRVELIEARARISVLEAVLRQHNIDVPPPTVVSAA